MSGGYCPAHWSRVKRGRALVDPVRRARHLDEAQQRQLAVDYSEGLGTYRELGAKYGVSEFTALRVVLRLAGDSPPRRAETVTTSELWRPLLGDYEVSSLGRIRRADAGVWRYLRARTRDAGGLLCADLTLAAGKHRVFLARSVLAAFSRPPQAGEIAAQRNGDPLDCRLANLEWRRRPEHHLHREELRRRAGRGLSAAPGSGMGSVGDGSSWLEGNRRANPPKVRS